MKKHSTFLNKNWILFVFFQNKAFQNNVYLKYILFSESIDQIYMILQKNSIPNCIFCKELIRWNQ